MDVGGIILVDRIDLGNITLEPIAILLVFSALVILSAVVIGIALVSRRWPTYTGKEGLVGRRAVVVEGFTTKGNVLFEGEYWKARSGTPLATGTEVTITAVRGLVLQVEPAADE